ncbi:MAG: DUF423 domain-containing protein [Isosphaeraceae bacterium]|nr:DUF423 domain-containing protein [Isosphaeraceae bacterium]
MGGATWMRIGAVLGALAVGLGAFGAHVLHERSGFKADVYETAVKYHMYHALALLAVGLLGALVRPSPALALAGWMFLVGTLLFSGSLYALAIGGPRWLAWVTPIGGLAFLVGWIALALAAGGMGRPQAP